MKLDAVTAWEIKERYRLNGYANGADGVIVSGVIDLFPAYDRYDLSMRCLDPPISEADVREFGRCAIEVTDRDSQGGVTGVVLKVHRGDAVTDAVGWLANAQRRALGAAGIGNPALELANA